MVSSIKLTTIGSIKDQETSSDMTQITITTSTCQIKSQPHQIFGMTIQMTENHYVEN